MERGASALPKRSGGMSDQRTLHSAVLLDTSWSAAWPKVYKIIGAARSCVAVGLFGSSLFARLLRLRRRICSALPTIPLPDFVCDFSSSLCYFYLDGALCSLSQPSSLKYGILTRRFGMRTVLDWTTSPKRKEKKRRTKHLRVRAQVPLIHNEIMALIFFKIGAAHGLGAAQAFRLCNGFLSSSSSAFWSL